MQITHIENVHELHKEAPSQHRSVAIRTIESNRCRLRDHWINPLISHMSGKPLRNEAPTIETFLDGLLGSMLSQLAQDGICFTFTRFDKLNFTALAALWFIHPGQAIAVEEAQLQHSSTSLLGGALLKQGE